MDIINRMASHVIRGEVKSCSKPRQDEDFFCHHGAVQDWNQVQEDHDPWATTQYEKFEILFSLLPIRLWQSILFQRLNSTYQHTRLIKVCMLFHISFFPKKTEVAKFFLPDVFTDFVTEFADAKWRIAWWFRWSFGMSTHHLDVLPPDHCLRGRISNFLGEENYGAAFFGKAPWYGTAHFTENEKIVH